jgi:hypothetical protein
LKGIAANPVIEGAHITLPPISARAFRVRQTSEA